MIIVIHIITIIIIIISIFIYLLNRFVKIFIVISNHVLVDIFVIIFKVFTIT